MASEVQQYHEIHEIMNSVILCNAENFFLRYVNSTQLARVIITEPPLGFGDIDPATLHSMIPHWLNVMEKMLQSGGQLYIIVHPLMIGEWIAQFPPTLQIRSILTVPLNNPISSRGTFSINQQFIIFASKGDTTLNRVDNAEVKENLNNTLYPSLFFTLFADLPKGEARIHPYQKNLDLLTFLIQISSKPHDLVIDPFAGSGMTALAAISTRRRFICLESDTQIWQLSSSLIHKAMHDPSFPLDSPLIQTYLDTFIL